MFSIQFRFGNSNAFPYDILNFLCWLLIFLFFIIYFEMSSFLWIIQTNPSQISRKVNTKCVSVIQLLSMDLKLRFGNLLKVRFGNSTAFN